MVPTIEQSGRKKKKRSVVWKFLKDDRDSFTKKCTICGSRIRTCNNTSNARFHLKKYHAKKLAEALTENSSSPSSDTESDEAGPSSKRVTEDEVTQDGNSSSNDENVS